MTTVETERFILRPFEERDIDFLDLLHSDKMVMRYIRGRTRSHDENIVYLNNLLEAQEQHGIGQRIVIRKQDNRPVGRCGLSFFYGIWENDMPSYYFDPDTIPEGEEATRVVELGYTFLRQSWGKGYATEAASAMRDYGLNEQKFLQLHSIIVKENLGSIAVAEKIGAICMEECLCMGLPGWDYASRPQNKKGI